GARSSVGRRIGRARSRQPVHGDARLEAGAHDRMHLVQCQSFLSDGDSPAGDASRPRGCRGAAARTRHENRIERSGVPRNPILLVEGDPALRESVADLLLERGYAVEREPTGAAALARLRQGPRPSLILLDLMMPEMTGWDLLSEMRKDARLDGI